MASRAIDTGRPSGSFLPNARDVIFLIALVHDCLCADAILKCFRPRESRSIDPQTCKEYWPARNARHFSKICGTSALLIAMR